MSTSVKMGVEHVGVESDWQYAQDMALQEFEGRISKRIKDWLEQRGIELQLDAELIDADIDGVEVNFEFEISYVFDEPSQALLFKLTFGGDLPDDE